MAFVDRYLPALLTQAAHQLIGSFTDVMRSHGLSVLEWRVLATLADSDAMSVGLLARRAATKQPTLTRLLDRMAQQGHVERGEHGQDRRLTLVRVTPAGRALACKLMEKAEAQQRVALQSFGPERLQQLEELLRLLIDRQGTSEDVVDVSSVKSCHRAVGTGGERPLSALVDPAQEGCRGGAASVP